MAFGTATSGVLRVPLGEPSLEGLRDAWEGCETTAGDQNRRDDVWLKHTLLSWNDGTPELWYKPTILEGQNKTYEPKERSY